MYSGELTPLGVRRNFASYNTQEQARSIFTAPFKTYIDHLYVPIEKLSYLLSVYPRNNSQYSECQEHDRRYAATFY